MAASAPDALDPAQRRNALVCEHLEWARRVARSVFLRLRIPAVDWADYVQAATVGLIEAADRYDPRYGVPFRAFAVQRVRGEVFNSLRTFLRSAGHSAAHDVLSERADSLDSDEGDPLQRIVALVGGLGTGLLIELGSMPVDSAMPCPAYGAVEQRQLQQTLLDAVDCLPERERFIVSMHYLQHLPFIEIASLLGLTKGRVSQLHKRAMERLRQAVRGRV